MGVSTNSCSQIQVTGVIFCFDLGLFAKQGRQCSNFNFGFCSWSLVGGWEEVVRRGGGGNEGSFLHHIFISFQSCQHFVDNSAPSLRLRSSVFSQLADAQQLSAE